MLILANYVCFTFGIGKRQHLLPEKKKGKHFNTPPDWLLLIHAGRDKLHKLITKHRKNKKNIPCYSTINIIYYIYWLIDWYVTLCSTPPFFPPTVVCHQGKMVDKGHYICDVFHSATNSWIRVNDNYVKMVPTEFVFNPSRAPNPHVPYLLFYRQSDTMVRRVWLDDHVFWVWFLFDRLY